MTYDSFSLYLSSNTYLKYEILVHYKLFYLNFTNIYETYSKNIQTQNNDM